MGKEEKKGPTPPAEQRLHLNMRPPSPATYRTPAMSMGNRVLVVVGAIGALLMLLCFLCLLLYALVAGDPG